MMTPRINRLKFITVFLITSVAGRLMAQTEIDLPALKKKYKDNDIVNLKNNENYEIDVKGDELIITSNTYKEILFLSEKSSAYARQEIDYVDFISTIKDFDAFTYVPKEKGGYKKVKVEEFEERKNTSEGVFYDDVSTKAFTFPQPVSGAIGVLDYTEEIKDPHFLGKFFFANWAPTMHSALSVKVHKDIILKYVLKNPSDDVLFEQKTEGNYNIYSWTRNNFAKVKSEGQAKPVSYELPHVIIHIASYKGKTETINILRNTSDLYNYCYSLLKKGVETPNVEIKRITDSLTVNAADELEKLRNIYYYVQQNIKYIAIEDGLGGYIPRKPSMVCDRKYGDCKDIANLLYTMLNYAKIPTYHTWIGTNDLPYRFDEVPVMGVANHMIATAQIDKQWYFLDGTANFLSYKYPSDFIQGKQAMLSIDKDSFLLLMVPIIASNKNYVSDTFFVESSGDSIKGRGVRVMDGLIRCSFVSSLFYGANNKIDEILEEYLQVGQNNCVVKNIKTTGSQGRDSLLTMTYEFKAPKYIHHIEDKMYINLNVDKIWDNSEIEIETRTRAFIFDRTNSYQKVIKFDIPADYNLDKLPENLNIEYPGFGFKFSYEQKKNSLIYRQNYWFDALEMNKSDFENWNKTIEHLYKAYNQTVVFKKKI